MEVGKDGARSEDRSDRLDAASVRSSISLRIMVDIGLELRRDEADKEERLGCAAGWSFIEILPPWSRRATCSVSHAGCTTFDFCQAQFFL